MKILLVEDDLKVARFMSRVLREEGYIVDQCISGTDAVCQAESGVYELVILDWMLPEMDGLAVCRELRKRSVATPILMLTARGETRERVLGLEAGADDYVVKPFEVDELVARVRALIRRNTALSKLRCGELAIDRLARRAALGGTPLSLTTREFALLVYLVGQAERVVTRSDLLARVWETNFDPGTNLVEVHMSRLREKLGDHSWMIETVRGLGYRMRAKPV